MISDMNTGKKIILSLLIINLITTVLITALPLAKSPVETPYNSQPGGTIGAAPGQVNIAPDAAPAVDLRCKRERDGKEVVKGTLARFVELIELVEFYSRKYFKLAVDYMFEVLDSLGVFQSDDLASSSNQVGRNAVWGA